MGNQNVSKRMKQDRAKYMLKAAFSTVLSPIVSKANRKHTVTDTPSSVLNQASIDLENKSSTLRRQEEQVLGETGLVNTLLRLESEIPVVGAQDE